MYCVNLTFECFENTTITAADRAISRFIEALRDNGQVIGREFPCQLDDGFFVTRAVCPQPDSVMRRYYSPRVLEALQGLHDAGLLEPKLAAGGVDLHADHSDPCYSAQPVVKPSWQAIYTNYLSTCSPLRCGEHFSPVPLYKLPQPLGERDFKPLLQWQQNWCALDELHMLGQIKSVSSQALRELSEPESELAQQGRQLAAQLTEICGIPTYYYLYRAGGDSVAAEMDRKCPACGGEWLLEQELHGLIDFRCDRCLLISSLSWDHR